MASPNPLPRATLASPGAPDAPDATRAPGWLHTLAAACPDYAPWLHSLKVFGAALTVVEKGGEKLTCPAAGPKVEIDHFFVRGLKAVSPVTVLPEAVASDHRPLVVTVRRNHDVVEGRTGAEREMVTR